MNKPAVSSAFRWRHESWGDALTCVPLQNHAQHLFSTKQLQLPALAPDAAWQLVAASLDTTVDRVFRIKQVHGRQVRIVADADVTTGGAAERPEADAIVSNVPGVVIAVQVADCVPLLMLDPRVGAAAAVHAGWRGTAAGVGPQAVETLRRVCGSKPEHLVVALGPSIGMCCYEVGPELIDAFRTGGASTAEINRWFSQHRSVHGEQTARASWRLDLWRANQDQLVASGVRANRIHISQLCTQTHSAIFDSYRVAGPRAGRMIAAIKVPHV